MENYKRENLIKEHGFDAIKILASFIVLLLVSVIKLNDNLKLALYILDLCFIGYGLFIDGIKDLIDGEIFGENTLMIIASVVAMIIGEYFEGVIIIILFSLGELLENIATDSSKNKIVGLSKLKIDIAHLVTEGELKEVSPKDVVIGSVIKVKKGERVPIDGIILDKVGEFDLKSITGESEYCVIKEGEAVFSGSINTGDAVLIKTTKLYLDSTAERIIKLVDCAKDKNSKTQKLITSFSKFYTPVIIILAVLISVIPPICSDRNFSKWIYKGLSFLVVSCPCAIVISVPLAYFVAIGSLAKRGVLVKGGEYLDALTKINVIALDKTGTLTCGKYMVDKIAGLNGYTEKDVISFAKCLEENSSHPIAESIKNYKCEFNKLYATNIKEEIGKGIFGVVENKNAFIGKTLENEKYNGSVLSLVIDKVLCGKIYIKDQIRVNARSFIKRMKRLGINKTIMFSGDNEIVCKSVANELGIKEYYYSLLPQDKYDKLQAIKKNGDNKIMFVGDGVNDAPSISYADIGVAMGGLGSEIAIDSAKVVIMDDDIDKIPLSIKYSKRTKRKVLQNVIGCIAVKLMVMALSLITTLPIWVAVISDVGAMLLAVLNSVLNCKVNY